MITASAIPTNNANAFFDRFALPMGQFRSPSKNNRLAFSLLDDRGNAALRGLPLSTSDFLRLRVQKPIAPAWGESGTGYMPMRFAWVGV